MPRSCSWSSVASAVRTVSVIAATVLGPWWSSTMVSRTIVIATTITSSLLPWGDIADGRAALPRLHVAIVVMALVISTRPSFNTPGSFSITRRCASGKFLHELLKIMLARSLRKGEKKKDETYLHLTIDGVSAANSSVRTTPTVAVITPVRTSLAIWAITGHVSGISTNTANNVCGEVALLGAVVLAMTDLAT